MLDAMELLRAMNGVHEEDVLRAGEGYLEENKNARGAGGSKTRRRIVSLALAAALLLALGVSAYGTYTAISTPQAAERVAREQVEVWKRMGLLSPEVHFDGPARQIVEIEEHKGSAYWYGRFFPHSYDVRWYVGPIGADDGAKYGCNLRVDTLTGKIMMAFIDAAADESDSPVRVVESELPVDFDDPTGEKEKHTYYYYDNFEDIFPADMTVDRCCTLLAEYWGFSGYRIADTVDESYGTHFAAIDGSTPLRELSGDPTGNYYLTVFFEGDQEGAPMYLQLQQFPGYVCWSLGTGHAVG